MGGNALTVFDGVKLKRYTAPEYTALVTDVKAKMAVAFPGARMEDIKTYRKKDSFGDLDLLIELPDMSDASQFRVHAAVRELFRPVVVLHQNNSNCITFSHKAFQIDVIMVPTDEYEFSSVYLAYNDLGNLIGRVAGGMGFKFGHDGLWYQFYETDANGKLDITRMAEQVLVSRDVDRVLQFLGYDPVRYREGFDTIADIYDFVVGGEFFTRELYLLENRNRKARDRDAKRKTYMGFLDHIGRDNSAPRITKSYAFPADHRAWLPRAFSFFPEFETDYARVGREAVEHKIAKAKFNGRVAQAATGLDDEALGAFMGWLRAIWVRDPDAKRAFQAWLVEEATTREMVADWIRNHLEAYLEGIAKKTTGGLAN